MYRKKPSIFQKDFYYECFLMEDVKLGNFIDRIQSASISLIYVCCYMSAYVLQLTFARPGKFLWSLDMLISLQKRSLAKKPS